VLSKEAFPQTLPSTGPVEERLALADRIIRALIDRVESATDFHGTDSDGTNYRSTAFSIFETAVAWNARVSARTADQYRALSDLANALAELRVAKEATEEAQRRLHDAIESINEGFAIFDADERLVLCNRTYFSLWPTIAHRIVPGILYEELMRLIGEAHSSLQTAVAPRRWISERMQQRSRATSAHVHPLADGRWIQIDELRTSEGGIVVVCTDITKVKVEDAHERARELAAKNALLQATLDTIHAGVCVYDRERRLIAWNQSFLSIIGLGDDGVTAVSTHALLLTKCLGDTDAHAFLALAWLSGNTPADASIWKQSDGRTIEVRRAVMPDGGMAMSFDDVTYRAQAAASLQAMNEVLEERVRARTSDLEALNVKLQSEANVRIAVEAALLDAKHAAEQSNADKTRFLAAVSHDLIQPLNAARLFVSALTNHEIPAASRSLVHQASSALDSVEDILEALLEISQLNAGAILPSIKDLDLLALLQSLLTEFTPFAAQRGLKLEIQSENFWVRSDARFLRRILQNLISNALRYTEHGTVTVAARRERRRILVEVEDTGRGIARNDRRLIFKEFSRLDRDRTTSGVGLGLAIVDRAARMLRHPLTLKSRVGVGSKFCIALPVGTRCLTSNTVDKETVGSQLAGCRVLAIDNEVSSLSALTTLLTQWGCVVSQATDGEQAAREYSNGGAHADIIIVDYHLNHGLLGDDLLVQLQAKNAKPIRAIVVTADRDEEVRKRINRKGFYLLNKPIKAPRLMTLMQYILTADAG
jgi:signal transduction histidine kinase